HESAGSGCSSCTQPPSATPGNAASKTSTLGCRRPSHASSASASRSWAGAATTPGRRTANDWPALQASPVRARNEVEEADEANEVEDKRLLFWKWPAQAIRMPTLRILCFLIVLCLL